jgi:hypothetical protein
MQTFASLVLRLTATLLLWLSSSRTLLVRADEAVLLDGRHMRGELTHDRDGRLRFFPTEKAEPLLLEQLQQVRLAAGDRVPLGTGGAQRLILRGGQWLTGELLALDAKTLTWRTVWGARLAVARDAVAAVTHAPGFVTVLEEDFETDLKAWKVTGTPTLTDRWHVSGQRSLVLTTAGQTVEYPLAKALEAGQLQVHFHEGPARPGAGWRIELEFETASGPRTLCVEPVANADAWGADGIFGPGVRQFVRRSSGWHRLRLEFAPAALLLTVDNAVLWHSRVQGPGGSLRSVRLASAASSAPGRASDEVAFADFRLARRVEDLPFRREDAGQDELWLLSGDQLLGHVHTADRRMLQLHGRFGERTFLWGEVRGLYLRQEHSPPRAVQGEYVRVWLRCEEANGRDELEGVVRRLDKTHLVLQHVTLGEVAIERARLHALRGLFHGRRIELENGFHHLGQNVVPTLEHPRPDGLSLRRAFHLEAVPEQAYVVVEVTELHGAHDGLASALARGDRATQFVVNDRPIAYLNRYVERASRTPQQIRLAVPRQFLRVGENILELRQTRDRDTGNYEDCGVSRLAVELPR